VEQGAAFDTGFGFGSFFETNCGPEHKLVPHVAFPEPDKTLNGNSFGKLENKRSGALGCCHAFLTTLLCLNDRAFQLLTNKRTRAFSATRSHPPVPRVLRSKEASAEFLWHGAACPGHPAPPQSLAGRAGGKTWQQTGESIC